MGFVIVNRLLLLFASVAVFSCSYSEQKAAPGVVKVPAEMIANSSFAEVYAKVLQPKCVGCHGSQGGVNLETFGNARSFLARIRASAVMARRMPLAPVPPLSEAELLTLAAWVEAGGPELPQNGAPTPNPLPRLEPTYSSIRANILVPKCITCHQPGEDAKNIPLLTRDDLLNSPHEIVLPGNPDESGIIVVTQPGARDKMPPPESGMSPLTQEEIAVIKDWITNGASN
jgi:uncharacterized membrane protein